MKIKQHSWKRHVAALILGMGILLASAAMQVQASENETDIWISDNRNTQDYTGDNWADRMYNYLTSTENGYMRIQLKKMGHYMPIILTGHSYFGHKNNSWGVDYARWLL